MHFRPAVLLRLLFVCAAFVATPALAQSEGEPLSAIVFESSAGDPIGGGASLQGFVPQWTITPGTANSASVSFDMRGPNGSNYTLWLKAAPSGVLDVGAYEEAARSAFAGASPGVEFNGNSVGCNAISGRFAVLDIAWNGMTLDRFAADFEQSCDGSAPLYGEIRYQSMVPLTISKPAGSTFPDPFAFTTRTAQLARTTVTSNTVSILGVNAPVPIAISGGEYSLNGGAFTSAAGTAVAHDHIAVRLLSPPALASQATATFTAGGRSATFTVATYFPGEAMTGFAYRGMPGDYITGGHAAEWPAPPNEVAAKRNDDNGVTFTIDTVGGGWWSLDFAAPGNALLVPGSYVGAARFPFQAADQPGLDAGGNGAGCSQVAGRFIVHEAVYNGDGSIARFAADFEQRCEIVGPPMYGEIRYNSSVPFSRLIPATSKRHAHDLDGDGLADLFWRGPEAAYGGWLMNGADARAYGQFVDPGSMLDVKVLGDFDGDGKLDFAGRYPDGRTALWLMDGVTVRAATTIVGPGTPWRAAMAADFDGDGKSDLLWRSDAGAYGVWLMNGTTAAAYGAVFNGAAGYTVTHAADLDGDGRADLVAIGPDGLIHIVLMRGATQASDTTLDQVGTGWTPVLVADVSGDGRADILLRHDDGRFRLLIMAGGTVQVSTDVGGAANGWNAIAAADLDGDGRADLVFQHADGRVAAWLMYGTQLTPTVIAGAGSGWSVIGADDYDGDGKADLLWRHQDGSHAIWLMDGLTPRSYRVILGGGTGWTAMP